MIDLYYWTTPNGHKITMFLEEAKMKYRVIPVNIGAGEQFDPAFLKIAPNNRIPAMVDHKPMQAEPKGARGAAINEPLTLFESGAMLLYLADKSKKSSTASRCIGAKKAFNGCSGKWAGWVQWQGKIIISAPLHRKNCRTRSTVT